MEVCENKNASMPKMVRCFRLDADAIESYKRNTAQFEGLKCSWSLHVSFCKKVKQALYGPRQALSVP